MELKKYIEMGEKRAGKQIELARLLGVRDTTLRLAKSGKMGLNDALCIELADYIKVDRLEVIAASNLVTEKDERKRKVFESCLRNTSKAATVTAAALIIGASAIVSPSPANASQLSPSNPAMYIM